MCAPLSPHEASRSSSPTPRSKDSVPTENSYISPSEPSKPSESLTPSKPSEQKSHLVRALRGEVVRPAPIWLMRQAGRYLPEYKKVRQAWPTFMDFCLNPHAAAEVTLHPIARFDLDAAIIFADITCLPHVMGHTITFGKDTSVDGNATDTTGVPQPYAGPRCAPIINQSQVESLSLGDAYSGYAPIGEAIKLVRKELPAHKAVIGFVGAPWTVACYLLSGGDRSKWPELVDHAHKQPFMKNLLARLAYGSARALMKQIDSGADVVMIFDTWAGLLNDNDHAAHEYVINPTQQLVSLVREHTDTPVIAFPKGLHSSLPRFVEQVRPEGLTVDAETSLTTIREMLDKKGIACPVLQGNISPDTLLEGGQALQSQWAQLHREIADYPHIVNLGHGVLPPTPTEHVAQLVKMVRTDTTPNTPPKKEIQQ